MYIAPQASLFCVAETLDLVRLGLRVGQCGQEHRSEDGNDGDHHQKFDQGKAPALKPLGATFIVTVSHPTFFWLVML